MPPASTEPTPAPPPLRRWLLVGADPLLGAAGRTLLTFLVDGATYRKVVVWGAPPDERTVASAGQLMVAEQDNRPIDAVYELSHGPTVLE